MYINNLQFAIFAIKTENYIIIKCLSSRIEHIFLINTL